LEPPVSLTEKHLSHFMGVVDEDVFLLRHQTQMKIKIMFIANSSLTTFFSFFTVAFDQSFSLRYVTVVLHLSLKR